MIYIVEVPHQLPPRAWARDTEQEIIEVIYNKSYGHIDDGFEAHIDENAHDLQDHYVFMNEAEAHEALDDDDHTIHRHIEARIALRECLKDHYLGELFDNLDAFNTDYYII